MKFVATEIPEVLVVEPDVHRDPRGFFLETWHAEKYREGGIAFDFVQDNHSRSARGTLRGIHAQLDPAQGKLVRVVAGEVWDVAVDLRIGSPTFGRHVGVTLGAEDFRQLWIPPGFGHGFCVLSESADLAYKCTARYEPAGEIAIAWDDPELAVPWPVDAPTVSDRDRSAPGLHEVKPRLPRYAP